MFAGSMPGADSSLVLRLMRGWITFKACAQAALLVNPGPRAARSTTFGVPSHPSRRGRRASTVWPSTVKACDWKSIMPLLLEDSWGPSDPVPDSADRRSTSRQPNECTRQDDAEAEYAHLFRLYVAGIPKNWSETRLKELFDLVRGEISCCT